jgi:hypothetical protein
MKKADFDLRYVSDGLVVMLVCAAVSALILWYSLYFRGHYQAAYDDSQSQFRRNSEQYLSVDEDMRIIREKYPRFIDLYNKGVVGRENRLNWLETLRSAAAGIKMPGLRYEIKAQETNNPPYLVNVSTGNFQVYSSKMQLSLGLLHEYDLSALLDDLSKRATGLYSVSSCKMTRAGEGPIVMDPAKPNINAVCDLDWYTVNLPGEGLVINQ